MARPGEPERERESEHGGGGERPLCGGRAAAHRVEPRAVAGARRHVGRARHAVWLPKVPDCVGPSLFCGPKRWKP